MLAIELQVKELERIEKIVSKITKVSVSTTVISIIVWIWIQAPSLDFTLPFSGGGSVSNINVGYAVIFGPFVVGFFLSWQFILRNKLLLLVEALNNSGENEAVISLDSFTLILGNFASYKNKYYLDTFWIVNSLLRDIFYYFIPGLVALVCFFRLIDFVPMEIEGEPVVHWVQSDTLSRYNCIEEHDINPCKWNKVEHVKYWLFGVEASGVQPTMMIKDIERDQNKGGSFPYIYPYTVWLILMLLFVNIMFARHCYILSKEPSKKMYNNKALVQNKDPVVPPSA